jgi:hypothetical protein
MKPWIALLAACLCGAGFASPNEASPDPAAGAPQPARPRLPLTSQTLINPAPYIPPQCYTRTKDDRGGVHNPCYTCHTSPQRPNFTRDAELQLAYAFPDLLTTNHWRNLFRDRNAAVTGQATEITGRVEMWCGGLRYSLSVAAPFVWRCLNSLTITPFPHPAHQTGHADFPHPAFGQNITPSPTAHYAPDRTDERDVTSRRSTRQDKPRPHCV